jgi:hypothetical protein
MEEWCSTKKLSSLFLAAGLSVGAIVLLRALSSREPEVFKSMADGTYGIRLNYIYSSMRCQFR